ncbi:hypothetical protein FRUB_01120 [Fimbriiglobus ruber]|uniref:VTC domain-containing protein n=1 Tax=Fimbriiglobus ruber TaxID=1908690 RepID=A0A225E1H6_9BACT|nr:hypothetical protein FRUB_01120 [Fimbriiglobus ruber]
MRVTFDRNIRGVTAGGWELDAVGTAPLLLTDRVVCEFKFRIAMPALLKGLVADLNLVPAAFSKYRNFVLSTGLVPARGDEAAITQETEIRDRADAQAC